MNSYIMTKFSYQDTNKMKSRPLLLIYMLLFWAILFQDGCICIIKDTYALDMLTSYLLSYYKKTKLWKGDMNSMFCESSPLFKVKMIILLTRRSIYQYMTESNTYGDEFKGSPHLWKKFCMQPYNLLYS